MLHKEQAGDRLLSVYFGALGCSGVVRVFFFVCVCVFCLRPLGHAQRISKKRDPPHPSCVCVHARAALRSPLSLLFDSNGHIRRPAPW